MAARSRPSAVASSREIRAQSVTCMGRRSLHALHAVLGLERASTTLGCSLHYSGLHTWAKSPPYLVSSLDQTLCAWQEPRSCVGRVQQEGGGCGVGARAGADGLGLALGLGLDLGLGSEVGA